MSGQSTQRCLKELCDIFNWEPGLDQEALALIVLEKYLKEAAPRKILPPTRLTLPNALTMLRAVTECMETDNTEEGIRPPSVGENVAHIYEMLLAVTSILHSLLEVHHKEELRYR